MIVSTNQHLPTVILIAGRGDDEVGYATQIAQVEGAVVGGTILTYHTSPIDSASHI